MLFVSLELGNKLLNIFSMRVVEVIIHLEFLSTDQRDQGFCNFSHF